MSRIWTTTGGKRDRHAISQINTATQQQKLQAIPSEYQSSIVLCVLHVRKEMKIESVNDMSVLSFLYWSSSDVPIAERKRRIMAL